MTALVDISNYVMFEFGRPSHIFDLDKIHGGLTVRWGKAGEQLKLLNGNTIGVDDKVGVAAGLRHVGEDVPASLPASVPGKHCSKRASIQCEVDATSIKRKGKRARVTLERSDTGKG